MSDPAGEFDITIRGLEAGLQVQHIATLKPRTCDLGTPIDAVVGDPELLDFDYIPIVENHVIVGVVEKYDEHGVKLSEPRKVPLSSAMLVSGNLPLPEFIPLMRDRRYWLVVRGTGATGLVTRSDVLKLPVRLYAFSLVIHLETIMATLICILYPDGHARWLNELSASRWLVRLGI
jgi:hypothetical protein